MLNEGKNYRRIKRPSPLTFFRVKYPDQHALKSKGVQGATLRLGQRPLKGDSGDTASRK